MFSHKIKIFMMLTLMLIFVPVTSAQQASSSTQAAKATEYVTEKGFKTKVLEVKHREPRTIWNVLRSLGSGFKGADLSFSDEFKTLTVRDFPENIVTIEEALKRLDAPQASRPDIEFRAHVLVASDTDDYANPFPPELNDVIKQLQSTLSYKKYNLLTSIIQRTKEGPSDINTSGTIDPRLPVGASSADTSTIYSLQMRGISLNASSGAPSVQINQVNFQIKFPVVTGTSAGNAGSGSFGNAGSGYPVVQFQNGVITTALNVRDGEKVVVGTASLRDKGLILVLSAKVTK